jgi:hypothetical protein
MRYRFLKKVCKERDFISVRYRATGFPIFNSRPGHTKSHFSQLENKIALAKMFFFSAFLEFARFKGHGFPPDGTTIPNWLGFVKIFFKLFFEKYFVA